MRDYLSVLVPLLREGSVRHRGEFFQVDGGFVVPGTSPVGCSPDRWWSPGVILAGCENHAAGRNQLWLVPADGTRPSALTPVRGGHSADFGDIGAWSLPGGLYLQALGLRSDAPDVHYGLATVCFLLNDLTSAAYHFKEVTRLDPLRAGAFINLGAG